MGAQNSKEYDSDNSDYRAYSEYQKHLQKKLSKHLQRPQHLTSINQSQMPRLYLPSTQKSICPINSTLRIQPPTQQIISVQSPLQSQLNIPVKNNSALIIQTPGQQQSIQVQSPLQQQINISAKSNLIQAAQSYRSNSKQQCIPIQQQLVSNSNSMIGNALIASNPIGKSAYYSFQLSQEKKQKKRSKSKRQKSKSKDKISKKKNSETGFKRLTSENFKLGASNPNLIHQEDKKVHLKDKLKEFYDESYLDLNKNKGENKKNNKSDHYTPCLLGATPFSNFIYQSKNTQKLSNLKYSTPTKMSIAEQKSNYEQTSPYVWKLKK